MAYSPSDFGLDKNGPQFAWLDARLTLHGFPPKRLMDNLKDRTQLFQQKQGWSGSGADGLVGPKTLSRLTADPAPAPSGIDLSPWKVTLPVGDPDEIYPIGSHEEAPWFVNHGPAGVTFRARVDGATTSNSGYARSELREMNRDGSRADWSNEHETHRVVGSCSVIELPGGKRELVFAQIHDAGDDVVMLLVSGDRVYASWSKGKNLGSDRAPLFSGYQLGSPLNFQIVASPDGVSVNVNGYKSARDDKRIDGAYFKAGCYLQANESNGTGAGEVLYTSLSI